MVFVPETGEIVQKSFAAAPVKTALTAKLEEVRVQAPLRSEQALSGLASADKEALRNLAARMEAALQQAQASDKERTSRIDAILENQQEILDDMTGTMSPVRGKHVSSVAAAKDCAKPVQLAFHIGSLDAPVASTLYACLKHVSGRSTVLAGYRSLCAFSC